MRDISLHQPVHAKPTNSFKIRFISCQYQFPFATRNRMRQPFVLNIPLRLFLFLLLPILSGCGDSMKYVFNYTRDVKQTPAAAELDYEDVYFSSADSTRLHGWYVPGDPDKPVVLFFHGNAANISYRVENLAYLHQLGVSVFIFDYRGYGQSEGEPLTENDLYADGRAACDLLFQRGWERGNIIFFGRSLGAAVALQIALELEPAQLIMEAPFTSIADIAWHTAPLSFGMFGRWNGVRGFNNLEKIDQLSLPLLMIHGGQDKIVPTEMGLRLYAAATEPKSFLEISDAGHSDCYIAGGEEYRSAWLSIIRKIQENPLADEAQRSSFLSNNDPGSAIKRQSSSSINSSAASPGPSGSNL